MSEAALYYESFDVMARGAAFCRGDDCPGWFLSEVDTWHKCGCGAGDGCTPYDDELEAMAAEYAAEVLETERLGGWEVREVALSPLDVPEPDDLPF